MQKIIGQIAAELKVGAAQVTAAVELLDGGATVPFIARYRKEATGGLDDAQLRELQRLIHACRTRGHRIHCKVGYGFAVRNGPHLGWYNP